MNMITEDYVSFETSKLLKEKGFAEICRYAYGGNGKKEYEFWNSNDTNDPESIISKPTVSIATKWLRKTHNIFIEISVDEMFKDEGYQWSLYYDDTKRIMPYSGWEETPEKACEAAIKYSLENLI